MSYYVTEERKVFMAEALYEPVMVERDGSIMTWPEWEEHVLDHWESEKELLVSTYYDLFRKSKDWINWVVPLIGRAPVRKYVRVYMSTIGYVVGIVYLEGMAVTSDPKWGKELIETEIKVAHAYGVERGKTVSEFAKIVKSNLRLSAPALRGLSSGG